MPKVKAGGRPYKHLPDKQFQAWNSNTICDVTGFRVKTSEVQRRWEGFYVIPQAWNPRQPQDFPVVPQKQHVYKDARKSDSDDIITQAIPSITPV